MMEGQHDQDQLEESQHYQFELTPSQGGTYSVYLDFISLLSQRRVLTKSSFDVVGEAEAPRIEKTSPIPLEGYTFKLRTSAQGSFPAGEETELELTVQPQAGNRSPEFGVVMGAYAHLVVFDEGGKGFAHLHPQNPFVNQQDPADPDLRFSFFPANPGKYRLWAQMMLDGQERFVPFDLEVVDGV